VRFLYGRVKKAFAVGRIEDVPNLKICGPSR